MELGFKFTVIVDDNIGQAFKNLFAAKDTRALFLERLFDRFGSDSVKESELKIMAFMLESKSNSRYHTKLKQASDENPDKKDVANKPRLKKQSRNNSKRQSKTENQSNDNIGNSYNITEQNTDEKQRVQSHFGDASF